jgi:hypothetical protein
MDVQTDAGTGATRKRRPWSAFNIQKKDGYEKPFWHKIGVAWPNRDGSFTIVLESLPMDGKVHIREERDRTDRKEAAPQQMSIERVE